jgi:hypothetical protein
MAKSLSNPNDRQEVMERLHRLSPQSRRQWGRMTPHQMICHLSDSFRAVMGEKDVSASGTVLHRTVARWIALHVPVSWPRGYRTRPEMDQEIGGTRPADFEQDRSSLERLVERFTAARKDYETRPHPVFGEMSEAELHRWGYLHMDHHLRQFGL